MSEGEFEKRLKKLGDYSGRIDKTLSEARKEIFEAIDKHIEELVAFWQSKSDPQKQKVAQYYIDAYRCIQHNIKEEDAFKLLKWFGDQQHP
ncbi:hypothetical protein MUP77_21460 [Candidatus Bathyarchaeota archaeon]|nr:hypothetical protein [Candidatus Bathyarchaeota archaeon]